MSLKRPLFHPGAYCSEACVDFSGRRSKNQRNDCVSSDLDILERAHNVDFSDKERLEAVIKAK